MGVRYYPTSTYTVCLDEVSKIKQVEPFIIDSIDEDGWELYSGCGSLLAYTVLDEDARNDEFMRILQEMAQDDYMVTLTIDCIEIDCEIYIPDENFCDMYPGSADTVYLRFYEDDLYKETRVMKVLRDKDMEPGRWEWVSLG